MRGEAPESGRRVELTLASGILSERVRYLGRDRYPLRGLTILAGEKGLGKSTLTNAHLPAQVTRGTLDGELRGVPADVLVVTAEDDWASVVKPRLMAHGADLDRVHRVQVLDEAGQAVLTLPEDVALIEAQLDRLESEDRRVAMIVIDPVGAFLAGGLDSHKDAHVRRALAPLASMAECRDLAVIAVAHLTKDESARLISRVNGSGAFVNAARSVFGFVRDPDDPEGEHGTQRVLVHVASNWGRCASSLGMKIESCDVTVDDGSSTSVGHLVVTGEVDLGVEDLQRGAEESRADTEEEIAAKLADGPRPSREVKGEVADRLECSRKTVERAGARMAERGEIGIEPSGYPRTTTWTLLGDEGEDPSVGTISETAKVPTDEIGMSKGIELDGGVSGDGARGNGPTDASAAPCPHPDHRGSDWIGDAEQQVCGICHPRPGGSL